MGAPLPVLPQIIVEAGLTAGNPGRQLGMILLLDDAVFGKLDTVLTAQVTWTDISAYVIGFTITRPSTRLTGPLWNYQAGTISVTLDNTSGRFDPDNLSGPYVTGGVTQLAAMVPVRARAIFSSITYPLFSGFADGWVPAVVTYEGGYAEITIGATDAFKALAAISLPAVTTAVGAGADTGARVRDILNRAGWYASADRNAIGTGNSLLQATTLGDYALNLMQLAADSEAGQLYVSNAGAVTFRARRAQLSDARSRTPQAVFGDLPGTSHPAGAELAFAAVARATDDTAIANDIQATITGSANMAEVTDAASEAKYLFPRTYTRADLILSSDADARGWAQWILAVGKAGEDRFDSLQVDPQADPNNLWPQVLGREAGDRIQVWHRPAQLTGVPYSQGSATSPGPFAIFLTIPIAAGTYTVTWTVTLSGTVAAADANNFGMTLGSGPTLAAPSVNRGAAGVYPQPPVTFTVAAPDTITVKSWGNTATTGAVYAAAVPSPVAKDCFITGITHVWDSVNSAWLTTWTLTDATRFSAYLNLDDAALGQLGSNMVAF